MFCNKFTGNEFRESLYVKFQKFVRVIIILVLSLIPWKFNFKPVHFKVHLLESWSQYLSVDIYIQYVVFTKQQISDKSQ